jgi:nicotinamide mononucleotide transporter
LVELLGFATGAASVWLAVRESAWNWPIGIANSAFFLVLFWRSALYGNALLQVLYIGLGFYGWWNWVRGSATADSLTIRRVGSNEAIALLIATLIATAVIWRALPAGAQPFLDAFTVALSLTATYMLSIKLLENWLVWIVADLIYVPMYAAAGLYLTSLVYALFLAMCIVGLTRWTRSLDAP